MSLNLWLTVALLAGSGKPVEVATPVKSLVMPILQEACRAKSAGWKKESSTRLGGLLEYLFLTKTPAADEARIVLLDYYLGEANGFDLLDNISLRGKAELPYLKKYRNLRTLKLLGDEECARSLLLEKSTRDKQFRDAIDAIHGGYRLGVD
jgi:hypothetical protein